MRHRLRVGLLCLLALVVVSCGDDEETFKTENCAVLTVGEQRYTLCCRLTCVATWDGDDFRERCTEEATCTTATGSPCPLSVVQTFPAPPCLY